MVQQHPRQLLHGPEPLPAQLVNPALEITQHGSLIGIVPESIQALLQQISLHHPAVEREQFVELPFLVGVQMNPAGQQQPVLALDQLRAAPPLRKNSARRTSATAS